MPSDCRYFREFRFLNTTNDNYSSKYMHEGIGSSEPEGRQFRNLCRSQARPRTDMQFDKVNLKTTQLKKSIASSIFQIQSCGHFVTYDFTFSVKSGGIEVLGGGHVECLHVFVSQNICFIGCHLGVLAENIQRNLRVIKQHQATTLSFALTPTRD